MAQQEYHFNAFLTEVNGKKSDRTLYSVLAEFIGTEARKDYVIKFCGWWQQLLDEKPLVLDEADRKLLFEAIETSERIPIAMKAQLLEILK